MTIPNVGVTGVIQKPGDFNVLGQSIGGIAQMLQQIEQMRMQNAQQQAAQRYQEGLVANQQAQLQDKRQQEEMARRLAEQAQQQWETSLQALHQAGALNDGEFASYRLMGPTEGAKKLQERFAPQTVAGTDRLVRMGMDGRPQVDLGVDTTTKLSDSPTSLREYNAARGADLGRQPTDPTFDRRDYDQWLQAQTERGSSRNVTNVYGNTAASKSAETVVGLYGKEVEEARGLKQDNQAIDRMLTTLRSEGGVMAGPIAGRMVGVGQLLNEIGLTNDPSPENTRIFLAQLSDRVLPIVRKLAPVTEEDVKLLQQAKGGDITKMSGTGLMRLLELQRDANTYQVQELNKRIRESKTLPEESKADLITDISGSMPQTQRVQLPSGTIVDAELDPMTGRYFYYKGASRVKTWLNIGGTP